tara:strand:- start:581 stop:961 length:381 start_codon:yes stop_codon:yes gene_type:complete
MTNLKEIEKWMDGKQIEWMQGKLSIFKGDLKSNDLFIIRGLGIPRELTRSDGTTATLTPIKCIPVNEQSREQLLQSNGSYKLPVFFTYDENVKMLQVGRIGIEKNSRDRDSLVFNAIELENFVAKK